MRTSVALQSSVRPRRKWPMIGLLVLSSLLATAALLNLLPAPVFALWLLSVVVSEWGHWLALGALVLLVAGLALRRSRFVLVPALLALLLLLLPLLRIWPVAAGLPAQFVAAFGATPAPGTATAAPRPAPLVLADLWLGVAAAPVNQQRVTYVERDGQPLALDLYLPPANTQPAPGLVVIHGGSWQGGDSTQLATLNHYLAARGYVIAAITYRLAPEHRFPAAHDDVLAAIAYLRANAAAIGLDPTRLALLGRSAGGQLALLAAYTAGDPAIRGAIALYGPTDLPFGYRNPTNPAVLDSQAVLETYLGGPLDALPAVYEAASPINFVTPGTPPTLLIHGTQDELVYFAHSERLAVRLSEAGVPHLLLGLPGATHGCDANFSGPCGQVSTYAVERFLAAVMRDE